MELDLDQPSSADRFLGIKEIHEPVIYTYISELVEGEVGKMPEPVFLKKFLGSSLFRVRGDPIIYELGIVTATWFEYALSTFAESTEVTT